MKNWRAWLQWDSPHLVSGLLLPEISNGLTQRPKPESCVALRACEKNQDAAVAYLIIKKESQRQLHEQERQQRAEKRERRRAGKTANGEWVNIALLKMLTGMGFNRKLATEALRQTNNDDALAIGLLTNSDNVLEASLRASKSKNHKASDSSLPPAEKITQVEAISPSKSIQQY